MSYGGYEYNQGGDNAYGGGGGGGGFLNGGGDYGNQGMGGFGSPGTGAAGGGGKSRDQKTLLPVTVAQLMKATQEEPDAHLKVDNVELHQVKVVGQVVEVEETATIRAYKVDDGTGVVTCRVFIETDDNDYAAEKRASCHKGAYVQVVGQVREYQGQRHLSVHDMRPIKEGNEITHHLLEVIYVHCQNTKGRQQGGQGGAQVKMQMGMNMGMNMGMGGGMMMGGGGGGGGGGGMNKVQSEVQRFIEEYGQGEMGADITEVQRALAKQNISAQQVMDAVGFLAAEGHIYTTTDENHYKTTG